MNPTPQTPPTLAEIERLTNCLQKANAQTEHFERQWYLVGDERDRLRAENEALRADAERYRWLRAESDTDAVDDARPSVTVWTVDPFDINFLYNDELDKTIDTAIAEEHGE